MGTREHRLTAPTGGMTGEQPNNGVDPAMAFWPLAKAVLRSLGKTYYPEMERTAISAGMADCDWYLLLPALLFDPAPISAARLRVRCPYYSPHIYENRLKPLAKLGYLKAVNTSTDEAGYPHYEYRLTDSGRMTIEWIIRAADSVMAALHPMDLVALERLCSLLERLVLASLEADEPPGKWALSHSRKTNPGPDAPVMVRIDQYLTDLGAYRDDAHQAAWGNEPRLKALATDADAVPAGPAGLPPSPPPGVTQALETLTLLWRADKGELNNGASAHGLSVSQVTTLLEKRGHPRAAYTRALKALSAQGYVEGRSEISRSPKLYRLTERGFTLRQEIEDRTDAFFYAPWDCLSEEELAELKELLLQLWDGLKIKVG
jgi:DNA-binding MarR family transcriptional regulator/DNA-binding HxlR family transcriptional regulator